MSLEMLRSMLGEHKTVYNNALTVLEAAYLLRKQGKESCKTDSSVRHKQDTNYNQLNKLNTSSSSRSCFQKSSSQMPVDKRAAFEHGANSTEPKKVDQAPEVPKHPALQAGLEQITRKQLLNAASPRFKDYIPMRNGQAMSMDDIVDAAYALRPDLHVSQKSWGRACNLLTRYGASVCILLLDQAMQREENRVMKPAAYFNAMINRAMTGELHLQKSVMGLLKRDEQHDPANSNDTKISAFNKGRA